MITETLPNEEKERKLNPCPFCGGDAIEDRDCAGFYNYRCGKCKCSLYGDYEHHMTGRAAWNRRATPQPAPAQGVSDAWQPIETAPKDGTYIMLCNSAGSWIGMYQDTFASGWKPDNPWQSMMLNNDHMKRIPGKLRPTHWQPLLAPPAARSAQTNGGGNG